jgi:lysophospholipase L1-like esterase
VTPFAIDRDRAKIAAQIDRFNAVAREETIFAGAHFVDVTPISRRAATDPTLLAPDGLHPSAKMYAQWVSVILPQAEAALRGR